MKPEKNRVIRVLALSVADSIVNAFQTLLLHVRYFSTCVFSTLSPLYAREVKSSTSPLLQGRSAPPMSLHATSEISEDTTLDDAPPPYMPVRFCQMEYFMLLSWRVAQLQLSLVGCRFKCALDGVLMPLNLHF